MILALLWALSAHAAIERIHSSSEVVLSRGENCEPGQMYAVYPQAEPKADPVAYAEVQRFEKGIGCVAKISSHPKSPLVRVGDPTRLVDLTRGGQNFPGRYDLVREGHREYASRYKPLVYGGLLFGHTAAVLEKGEILAGLSPLMYGVARNFQVDFTWIRLFEHAGDVGAKYKIYQNEDMKLSARLQGTQYLEAGKSSWEAEVLFDSGSNGHSLSHTRLRFSSKVPEQIVFVDEAKRKDSSLELSTVNEWMLKSWHRILFGPKFVAGDTYDLGFLFSMIFLFDKFNGAINLDVNSVRHFDFKGYKQAIGFDLFWRI